MAAKIAIRISYNPECKRCGGRRWMGGWVQHCPEIFSLDLCELSSCCWNSYLFLIMNKLHIEFSSMYWFASRVTRQPAWCCSGDRGVGTVEGALALNVRLSLDMREVQLCVWKNPSDSIHSHDPPDAIMQHRCGSHLCKQALHQPGNQARHKDTMSSVKVLSHSLAYIFDGNSSLSACAPGSGSTVCRVHSSVKVHHMVLW